MQEFLRDNWLYVVCYLYAGAAWLTFAILGI